MEIPVVMMGYGLDDDGLHSPNEHYSIEMFQRGIETAIVYLEELAQLQRTVTDHEKREDSMEIRVETGDLLHGRPNWRCWPFEDVPCRRRWRACLNRAIFVAAAGRRCCSTRVVQSPRGACCWWAWASSKREPRDVRQAPRAAVQKARELQVRCSGGVMAKRRCRRLYWQAFTEGLVLGAYRDWHYRTGLSKNRPLP